MAALSVGLICATGCGIRPPIGEVTVDTLFILVCTISRNRFRPNRVLRRMALLNSHLFIFRFVFLYMTALSVGLICAIGCGIRPPIGEVTVDTLFILVCTISRNRFRPNRVLRRMALLNSHLFIFRFVFLSMTALSVGLICATGSGIRPPIGEVTVDTLFILVCTISRNRFRPNQVLRRMALLNSHLFIFRFVFLCMTALSVGLICATGCGIRPPIGEVTVDTLFILVCTISRNRFRPNRVLRRMALLNSHLFIFRFVFLYMTALSVGLICATGCGIRPPIGEVTVDTLFKEKSDRT